MADEDTLHIDITADSAQAGSAVSSLESRLASLETAFKKSTVGAEGFAKGSHKAKIAAEEAGGAVQKLGGFFTDVEEHSRTVNIALTSVGLKSEAVAAKIAGLGQLFEGLGKAVPTMLAIGAAVAAAGVAFDVLKDSAEKAAEWQHQMALLGATVRDQKGDWNALSESVTKWADVQERTTEFSRDEAVKAVTTLTATGMKLGDAMKVTRVAEDAAAATGRSLTEVNFALSEAMHGRTQALTQLGLGTKASIKDGMKFSTVLSLIEQNMGGAAAAGAETYSGKLNQLHNAFSTLEEEIGSAVLPALTSVVKALLGMIDSAEKGFKRWETAVHAFYLRNKEALDALGAAFKLVWDIISTDVRVALDAVLGIIKVAWNVIIGDFNLIADLLTGHWSRLWGDLKQLTIGGAEAFLSTFGTFGQSLMTLAERVTQSIGKMFEAMWKDIKSAHFGDIGKDVAAAFSGDLSGLKWSLGGGGRPDSGPSNNADIAGISSGLGDTMVGGKTGAGAHSAHGHAGHAPTMGTGRGSSLVDIAPVLNGPRSVNDPASSIEAVDKAINKMWEDQAKGESTADKAMAKRDEAAIKALQQQESEQKKLAAAQLKNYEEQQKFLSKLADKGTALFDSIFDRGKKGSKSFGDVFKETIKDIEHALEKSLLMQLLGGMFGMKTSFGANFGAAMGKGSSPLSGMLGMAMGGSHGGQGAAGGAMSNASSGGLVGSIIGSSGSASVASSLPTDSFMSMMFGAGAPGGVGGGSGSGGGGGALGIGGAGGAGGAAAILGADATGGTSAAERALISQVGVKGLGNIFKGGIPGISKALGFGQGSIWEGTSHSLSLGGAAIGVGAGQLFGNLWSQGAGGGSHSTWGSIAGGIGGLVGGPVGGLIGAGIGSIFGHADNPHDMPDKYDTQNYGTIIANLIGHAGANGQNFSMDSTIASIVGTNPITGQSQSIQGASGDHWNSGGSIAFIEELLSKYGSADKAPTWLQPMFNQMVSMFGMSSTGSGHLNFGQHINNETITGAQGASGQTFQYTDIGKAAEQFFEAYMQQGQVQTSTPNTTSSGGNGTGFTNPFANLPVYNVGNGMPTLVGSQTNPVPVGGPIPTAHTNTEVVNPSSGGGLTQQQWANIGNAIGGSGGGILGNKLRNTVVEVHVDGGVISGQDLVHQISNGLGGDGASMLSNSNTYSPGMGF